MTNSTRISRLERLYPLMHWIVNGIAAAVSKMAFGNALGVKIEHNLDPRDFFAPGFGDIMAWKFRQTKLDELSITYTRDR